jgi:hypothetical protein
MIRRAAPERLAALARAKRRRSVEVAGLVILVAGVAWFLAWAPPFVCFGASVLAAMAWCGWLERHPALPEESASLQAGWSASRTYLDSRIEEVRAGEERSARTSATATRGGRV